MDKSTKKIIRIQHIGGTGNRVFQFFFGRLLQQQVRNAQLIGYDIPLFNLKSPPPCEIPERHVLIAGKHEFNVGRIVYAMNSDLLDAVTLQTYSQRMEYLPDLSDARTLLASGLNATLGAVVPDDALLIHIRWPQPSDGGHGDYMPLPISFYKKIVESTGLRPIFMGQTEEGPYFERLKRSIPRAEFWPSATPLQDFNTIANARHIVSSVSSFSWLAAWLSTSAINIHLPVCGLLNPEQRADVDLLPYPDARLRYYQFPVSHWHSTPAQIESLWSDSQDLLELKERDVVQLKVAKFRAVI
jgi:hypothetical protein